VTPTTPSPELALQDRYAPLSICFGCGPANARGLRLKSYAHGELVLATFLPEEYQQAFPGMLNGGIIGALLDCHSNWTAAYTLMQSRSLTSPPCTVTADFHVKLLAPTPLSGPLELSAHSVHISPARPGAGEPDPAGSEDVAGMRCTVDAELSAAGKVTATCRGTFVAVKPGHPAYHRW
jgi:acyl-coenzyme A thioesterase PaaI-like protein